MKIYLFAALAFVVSLVGSAVVGSMLSSPPGILAGQWQTDCSGWVASGV